MNGTFPETDETELTVLVLAAQEGDRQAFGTLFERFEQEFTPRPGRENRHPGRDQLVSRKPNSRHAPPVREPTFDRSVRPKSHADRLTRRDQGADVPRVPHLGTRRQQVRLAREAGGCGFLRL